MTDKPAPTAATGTPRKAAAVAGQVAGVAGIVVCLLLVVGVIIGRGWLIDKVDGVIASVDAQLARAVPLLESADAAVSGVTEKVAAVGTAATAMSTATNPPPALAEALSAGIDRVAERYLPLRSTYSEARTTVVSTLERLQTFDRLVPGITVPTGPVDAVAGLDSTVQELDANVMAIIDANTGAEAAAKAAGVVAEQVSKIEAALGNVKTRLAEVETRLTAVRADLASTGATIDTAITVVSLLLILLLLYVAFLHLVLFRVARGLRASTPAQS